MDIRPKDATSTEATDVPARAETWRTEVSSELRHLAEITLGQALDAIVDEDSPMAPFVVLERPDGRVLGRFEGEPSAALARARAHVLGCDADRAAIAWDGCLTVGGIRQDAVIVAASDRGRTGVIVAYRYRETVEGTVIVGRPVLVGPTTPLLPNRDEVDTLGA
jgi:hypothetical protein